MPANPQIKSNLPNSLAYTQPATALLDPGAKDLQVIRPLEDVRWAAFLQTHPGATVFHSVPWLEALHRTYGYEPVVYTTAAAPASALADGLLACRIDSWATGRRLVSLPFSDHCEPLLSEGTHLPEMLNSLLEIAGQQKLKYVEIRPLEASVPASSPAYSFLEYAFHQLDLTPDLDTLFRNFHKDSTQRKIRRAEREGLIYEEGQSPALLREFCRLNLMTRRRHRVPPQPTRWFENLVDCFGPDLQIRVAFKQRQAVAAILTLRFKDQLVYKYGASDEAFNNLGGTHLLFWKSIQDAKSQGLRVFDLGRSDPDNGGLIAFKNRWGALPTALKYVRVYLAKAPAVSSPPGSDWKSRQAKRLLGNLPDPMLLLMGKLLYRHIG